MRRIGVHTSIAGGLDRSLERAHALGCTTVQIFSHNPRGWAVKDRGTGEVERFRQARASLDISPVVIHTSYLINLASPLPDLAHRSVDMLVHEMDIADSLGAEYVIAHTGSASGDNPAGARRRAIRCLREIDRRGNWRAGLLLENTAGERGDITSGFREMAEIMEAVKGNLISGICFDTCHAFAAGYDVGSPQGLEDVAGEIHTLIGKKRVRVIHFNDSKGALGSRVDRHEHIGQGAIGMEGLRLVLHSPFFSGIPAILETPKKTEKDDSNNLAMVRKLSET